MPNCVKSSKSCCACDDRLSTSSKISAETPESLKTRDRIVKLYVEATGKDPDTIKAAIERDTWMDAEEALEYGLVDRIVDKYADLD